MENQINFIFSFLCLCLIAAFSSGQEVLCKGQRKDNGFSKLFVFGDSYADTGNRNKTTSESWKPPYGITFPGKPSGRFTDGRLLTDYIATFYGIRNPVPYVLRNRVRNAGHNGMNFAIGGSGVFNTVYNVPTMTSQIDHFQNLIERNVVTKSALQSSVALVTLAGNDYTTFLLQNLHNVTVEKTGAFTRSVVKQLVSNLERLKGLGLKHIIVAGLQPIGCLPASTISSGHSACNDTYNAIALNHNLLLEQQVDTKTKVLDLFLAFKKVIGDNQRRKSIWNPLKPCCVGVDDTSICGSLDLNGEKKYTVCSDPSAAVFWDHVHPTQHGWDSIYLALRPQIRSFFRKRNN